MGRTNLKTRILPNRVPTKFTVSFVEGARDRLARTRGHATRKKSFPEKNKHRSRALFGDIFFCVFISMLDF